MYDDLHQFYGYVIDFAFFTYLHITGIRLCADPCHSVDYFHMFDIGGICCEYNFQCEAE